MSHTTLDTPETLKALARTNDIAKVRKLALHKIHLMACSGCSVEQLREAIETILVETNTVERNIINA